MQRGPARLHRIFYATRYGWKRDKLGYVRFRHWRIWSVSGLPGAICPKNFPRWLKACSFEAVDDVLRELFRISEGHHAQPSVIIVDARTLQSTPESGNRAEYDGLKRERGSKTHIAVDTLSRLLTMVTTPPIEQERFQVETPAAAVQEATGEHVELAFVDQSYTGEETQEAAQDHSIQQKIVKVPEAKRGFVLLRADGSSSEVCLGRALSPSGQGVRAAARGSDQPPRRGLCQSAAPTCWPFPPSS